MTTKITEVRGKQIYYAKTQPNAIIPTKREEDAGRDIYTCETETIVINPCSTRMIDTGVAIACSSAYFPKFFDKGGMGSKGIIVGAGVGDSGYRNNYFIPLINTNDDKWLIISTQSEEEIENSLGFSLAYNKFITLDDVSLNLQTPFIILDKENCIIKPIKKSITQFVMIEVPVFEEEEISWEDLKLIKSERGLGNQGSSLK